MVNEQNDSCACTSVQDNIPMYMTDASNQFLVCSLIFQNDPFSRAQGSASEAKYLEILN